CMLPLFACGFKAPPPVRTPPPAAPAPPPLSRISAELAVPVSEILEVLNARTRGSIADIHNQPIGCTIATCFVDLVIVRTGNITAAGSGDTVSVTIPLAMKAHVSLRGGFLRTSGEGSAQGIARAIMMFRLAPDWTLQTHTRGSIVLSEGQLKLGPVKMNIAELWNHNAGHVSDVLFKTLDREIVRKVKIKAQAEKLWAKLARPIQIGRKPQTWLLLAPRQISVTEPAVHGDALILSLALAVRAQLVVTEHSPTEDAAPQLPSPAHLSAPSNRFALAVPVLLPYDSAAKLAMQRLAARPLRIGGMRVRVDALSILPSGQDVIVAASFCVRQGWDPFGWFDSCGTGYLRGAPEFESRSQTIRIANVHYDIATESLLLSVLKALAGNAFAKTLEPRLVFAVGGDIARLHAELISALAKPQGREIRISGAVESFGTPSFTWTRDGFLAFFIASGHLTADWKPRMP
ncbi:MAG: DUF4403 family protein, partial [Rhizomicrobium sp.]